jgi:hypothetical protein
LHNYSPISTHKKKAGVGHVPVIPVMRKKHDIGELQSRSAWAARPYLQNKQRKRAGDMVQAVECLPSKRKALSSNHSTPIKK